jgi:hypothetical protein
MDGGLNERYLNTKHWKKGMLCAKVYNRAYMVRQISTKGREYSPYEEANMNPINLLWIIPLSASIGAFLMAVLIGGTHGSDLY